jgi:hypothetical protein
MTAARPAPKGIAIVTGPAELPWGGRCSRRECPYAVWPVLLPGGVVAFRVGLAGQIFARKEAACAAGMGLVKKMDAYTARRYPPTLAEQSDDFAALNRIAGR